MVDAAAKAVNAGQEGFLGGRRFDAAFAIL